MARTRFPDSGWSRFAGTLAVLVALTAPAAPAFGASAPAVGETYVYRLVNGFSREALARIRYQVTEVSGDRVTVSVEPDSVFGGEPRTEIYTVEGNWLRRVIESHGYPVLYDFERPYPALVFPLEPGKSWSVRVNARVPGLPRVRSVRVDGRVVGRERIRVPAGEFDTLKVVRSAWPGDPAFSLSETRIAEIDWYAPAIGRVVRTERRSEWLDMHICHEDSCDREGDWSVLELVEAPSRS